jgi:hypothetical protein
LRQCAVAYNFRDIQSQGVRAMVDPNIVVTQARYTKYRIKPESLPLKHCIPAQMRTIEQEFPWWTIDSHKVPC